jgi:hypothetical protein
MNEYSCRKGGLPLSSFAVTSLLFPMKPPSRDDPFFEDLSEKLLLARRNRSSVAVIFAQLQKRAIRLSRAIKEQKCAMRHYAHL